MWKAPTYFSRNGLTENVSIRCQSCRADKPADMMIYTAPLPITINPRKYEYLCDGCSEGIFRKGQPRKEFFEHLGCPPAHANKIKEFEGRVKKHENHRKR